MRLLVLMIAFQGTSTHSSINDTPTASLTPEEPAASPSHEGAAGNPLTQATTQPADQGQSTSPLPELDIDSDFGEDLSDFDTEVLWGAKTDFGFDLADIERIGTPLRANPSYYAVFGLPVWHGM